MSHYENGTWLDKPYYSKNVNYTRGATVEAIAEGINICVNDLLKDNYNIAHYPLRFAGALSADIFIPSDAHLCDPLRQDLKLNTAPDGMLRLKLPSNIATPLYFLREYNICLEELSPYESLNIYTPYDQVLYPEIRVLLPENPLPCYNDEGKRLRYVDDYGYPLKEPVYSDLEVYLAPPNTTLDDILEKFVVCLVDLVWINQFPDLPALVDLEIFIPPVRPCDENVTYQQMKPSNSPYSDIPRDINAISLAYNICPEELVRWNPQLVPDEDGYLVHPHYKRYYTSVWALIPEGVPPCYEIYKPVVGTFTYDIEHQLNICHESFIWQGITPHLTIESDTTILYYRHDAKPCYDEQGRRLQYTRPIQQYSRWRGVNTYSGSAFPNHADTLFTYSDLPLHAVQHEEYIIDISRRYNICVNDLLDANPHRRGTGYTIFLPQTRPCYDTETGFPIIYEDENGNQLAEPQASDKLMHYGLPVWGEISYYYNVCINRIEDANRAKINKEVSYLGWIIPTNRPPCYDANGRIMSYVCYDQPIALSTDYSLTNLTFNRDGTHCYNLATPNTLIWYRGKAYQARSYQRDDASAPDRWNHIWEGWLINSPAFSAWCFGVSESDIISANATPALIDILPYQYKAIPKPTRECYIDHPEWFEGKTVHVIVQGDTLSGIAHQYDVPRLLIALVNGLDMKNPLWLGQKLIIPTGISTAQFYALMLGGGVMFLLIVGLILPLVRRKNQAR